MPRTGVWDANNSNERWRSHGRSVEAGALAEGVMGERGCGGGFHFGGGVGAVLVAAGGGAAVVISAGLFAVDPLEEDVEQGVAA